MPRAGQDPSSSPPRRGGFHPALGVALWVLATLVATSAIGVGVSVAARSVIGAPLATLGAPDVARLATTPTTSTPVPTTTTVATRLAASGAAATTTVTSLPALSGAPSARHATGTTLPPVTTTTSVPRATKAQQPQPRPVSATLDNKGGFVNVTCVGTEITLDSAIPANGYAATVVSTGPRRVDVTFTAADDVAPLAAICSRGRPILQPRPTSPPPPPPPPKAVGQPSASRAVLAS